MEPIYLPLMEPIIPRPDLPPPIETLVVLDPTVFYQPIRKDILHLCVTHYRDALRQGSANTKTRSEVRGSGRKIMQQKGTGKARVGDAYSPIRRGGGIAFGPKPRDFSTKLPRKVIEMGLRVALSAKVKDTRLGIMPCLEFPIGKTNPLAKRLEKMGVTKTLFVTGEDAVPTGLQRAGQNIPLIEFTTADKLNVYDALKWQRLILDLKAVDYFEQTLGRGNHASDDSHVSISEASL